MADTEHKMEALTLHCTCGWAKTTDMSHNLWVDSMWVDAKSYWEYHVKNCPPIKET